MGELKNDKLFSEEDLEKAKKGFTFEWYDSYGSNLFYVILLSTLLSNWDEVSTYLQSTLWRWVDRSFKL